MSIKKVRRSSGMTQCELAKHLGVMQHTVSMWETGKTHPRMDKLYKMMELFGCTADELVSKE